MCSQHPAGKKRSHRISVDVGRSPIDIQTTSIVDIKASLNWPGRATSGSHALTAPDVEMLSFWLVAGTSGYSGMIRSDRGAASSTWGCIFLGLLVKLRGVHQETTAQWLLWLPYWCFTIGYLLEGFWFLSKCWILNENWGKLFMSCGHYLKAQSVKFTLLWITWAWWVTLEQSFSFFHWKFWFITDFEEFQGQKRNLFYSF